ncbi:c-type cytochrome domain-containing protein [Algibacillus agarilyticus]|uniref:c-type cytochrome domain-containing protein n=1 Tax=Algibacillus agarilyticus TaxID=2234133 RepID=UPI000DCF880B|nr:c-type cytochrome domain-containing protein [Algibacillus agarilyticus]
MNNTPQNTEKAKRYFIIVGLLSVLWLVLFVRSQPHWIQHIKEDLGLTPVLQASDDSFYNSRIDPIFEKYCVACHDSNKAKGHLRLDSFRQLNFSGRSEADLRQADHNLLIERMMLPETDRLAMPPYGRDRQTEEELALIKLWLTKGSSGTLTEADFPEAPAKAKVITFTEINWHTIEQNRKPYEQQVHQLQNQYPFVLQYQARTSNLLIVNSFAIKARFDDQLLTQFNNAVGPIIAELDLSNTKISSDSITTLLTMSQLSTLKIPGVEVENKQLIKLAQHPTLKTLLVDEQWVDEHIENIYTQQSIELIKVKQG